MSALGMMRWYDVRLLTANVPPRFSLRGFVVVPISKRDKRETEKEKSRNLNMFTNLFRF